MAAGQSRPPERAVSSLATLKNRSEFLRVRNGARFATVGFVLEARRRRSEDGGGDRARVGFTVSKKVGTAVERNRIKRRLKAAMRDVIGDHAKPEFDYVLIARRAALHADYVALVTDLTSALSRVHIKRGEPPLNRGARTKSKA